LAEYRRQIVSGGIVAILLAISIGLAVIYVPTLNLNGTSTSTSSSPPTTTSANSSSSTGVTIYLNKSTTSGSSITRESRTSTHSPTETVTVTRNGTVTTVYRNGTETIYQNNTETTTVTNTQIETVTVTFISSSNTSSGAMCPRFEGPGSPSYCVPITLSNSQLSPVPPGTQLMLRIDWQSFESYLASNVGNVIFTDSSGVPVYAWCESSCSSSQPVSNVWVKDDAAISAAGQQEIFMYIFPTSQIQYSSSGFWGAFPILTGTYGQYDNGPKVFDFYNNFNGSALCNCLTAVPFLGGQFSGGQANYSVGNGLTITATGAPSGAGFGYHIYLNKAESYSAIDSNLVATDLPTSVSLEAAYRYNAMDLVPPATSYLDNGFKSSYSSLDLLCGCGSSLSIHLDNGPGENGSTVASGSFQSWIGVQSIVWPSAGSQFANSMEIQQVRGSDSTLSFAPTYADIAFINGLPSQHYMTFHWMRTRNTPPNNVMPTDSLGSIYAYS